MFYATGSNRREQGRCLRCDSISRWRALAHVVSEVRPDWKACAVHESSASDPTLTWFRSRCPGYVATQYFPGIAHGAFHQGFRCEDLGAQSFADGQFDLVLTQDVLEHLPDPVAGLREIARTLKPEGLHVFTVPWYRGIPTRVRSRFHPDGRVEHLLAPQYHGNPVDPRGCLVVTDWGDDLADLIHEACGMVTTIHRLEDPRLGILGNVDIFVSRKSSGASRLGLWNPPMVA